ncbi:acetolactate decarboxylase [Flavobacterium sp. J372]|uniref:acetolactate decarboxylase n=1 Tax=Flavobacterium sp. J372 TaxID=2898436 RepID=UPI002151B404|nr:acetolactate decarboxylase [Flavobacterium sp. J372]MCR5863121.1 acetolactate decarboxylase [Flavobacterium sp. J372]
MKFMSGLVLMACLFFGSLTYSQNTKSSVIVTGAMKNVMWNGQLKGAIQLDTIANKKHLYGLGPIEGLRGEIMIIDGKCYTSYVKSSTEMKVVEDYQVKAPFFVHGYADDWKEIKLPDNVVNLKDLENYLGEVTKSTNKPFVFKLTGVADEASIHVVNLPEGAVVKNPDDAHKGQVSYKLDDEQVIVVGFYSRNHQSVFTHHDTYMHLHLITKDKAKMGHVDELKFKKGAVQLYLPK